MSDGMFLMVAALAAVAFVVLVLATNPHDRNPHVNARRSQPWWKRPPS